MSGATPVWVHLILWVSIVGLISPTTGALIFRSLIVSLWACCLRSSLLLLFVLTLLLLLLLLTLLLIGFFLGFTIELLLLAEVVVCSAFPIGSLLVDSCYQECYFGTSLWFLLVVGIVVVVWPAMPTGFNLNRLLVLINSGQKFSFIIFSALEADSAHVNHLLQTFCCLLVCCSLLAFHLDLDLQG